MNIGTLIYNLNYNIKRTIRKLENLNKKKNSIECSIIFNESCLQQNILPNYTNIYIYIY